LKNYELLRSRKGQGPKQTGVRQCDRKSIAGPTQKNMFTKEDEEFERMAADPARRREGIADLSSRRNIMFWCATGMTLCALVTFFMSFGNASRGSAAAGFTAAIQWILLFKYESELKLLRVVDRLHPGENGNPVE
jgi:hypothetical protein